MTDTLTEDETMTKENTARELVAHEPQEVAPVTPMQMLQIAVERGADLDQLDKLMTLQERYEATQARKAFVKALAAFKADPPKITKNKHVRFSTGRGQTEYDHATLDHVCDVVGKGLARHGLSHTWSVKQHENAAIEVTCTLTHELGHSESVTMRGMPDDSGSKNLIQQVGSTTTYLQRYTLLCVTGLAAGDTDTDGVGPADLITPEQKAELVKLQEEVGADTGRFLKFLGIEALDYLPARRFEEARNALEAKRKVSHENP